MPVIGYVWISISLLCAVAVVVTAIRQGSTGGKFPGPFGGA